MYLLGSVRRLRSGDYLCFVRVRGTYQVRVCKLPKSRVRQYLVARDGYILLVREIPIKPTGVKRYYYKIPSDFVHYVGRKGAYKVYRISPLLIYRSDTLYRVESVQGRSVVVEYQQRSLLGELFHSISSLFGGGKPRITKGEPQQSKSEPYTPFTAPSTSPNTTSPKTGRTNTAVEKVVVVKEETKFPIWLIAIPVVALLLAKK